MIGTRHITPLIVENLDHVIAKVGGKDVVSSCLLIGIAIGSVIRKSAAGIHRVNRIGAMRRSLGIIDYQRSLIHGHLGIRTPGIQSAVLGEKDKLSRARVTFGNLGSRLRSEIHSWP